MIKMASNSHYMFKQGFIYYINHWFKETPSEKLVKKDMDVNEHENLPNITLLRHKIE